MFEISDKTPQRALEESNNKNIEVVREKYRSIRQKKY